MKFDGRAMRKVGNGPDVWLEARHRSMLLGGAVAVDEETGDVWEEVLPTPEDIAREWAATSAAFVAAFTAHVSPRHAYPSPAHRVTDPGAR